MQEEFRLELPSEPLFVGVARLAVANIANKAALPEEDVEDIKVCLSEACNTIIQHPAREKGDTIGIACAITNDGLSVKVSCKSHVLEKKHWEKHHEMGKTLVETLMDDVRYEKYMNGNSSIEMTKYFPINDDEYLRYPN